MSKLINNFISITSIKLFVIASFFFLHPPTLTAQNNSDFTNSVNIVLGIGQITQGGFNIEGNVFYKKWAFDYSHGVALTINNSQLENGNDKDQGLSVHLPWTTGFGVGYRLSDWLNVRVEPKWHRFEISNINDEQIGNVQVGDYTTFTLGLGLYANLRPFKRQDNLLKGIMIVPNFRWWPKVFSSLEDDQFTYFNEKTQQEEVHKAREIGIANSPFFYNISVGYSINF